MLYHATSPKAVCSRWTNWPMKTACRSSSWPCCITLRHTKPALLHHATSHKAVCSRWTTWQRRITWRSSGWPCCITLRHTNLYVTGGQHGRGGQRGGLQACLPQRTAAGAGRGADPAAVRVGPRDGPQHHHADGPAHGQGLPSGHV